MPTYTVTNTRGDVVATIGVATTTADDYPIELIGQGISLYGPIVASTQYRLMEHFADDEFLDVTLPTTTIPEGLIQYRYDQKIPYIWDGSNWIRIATGFSSSSVLFTMHPDAENIDFTTEQSKEIFVPSVPGFKYYPTGLMLIPTSVSGVPVSDTALFSLGTQAGTVTAPNPPFDEDMLETTILADADADKHVFTPLSGHLPTVGYGATYDKIWLNVRQPSGATALTYDALLFGLITE